MDGHSPAPPVAPRAPRTRAPAHPRLAPCHDGGWTLGRAGEPPEIIERKLDPQTFWEAVSGISIPCRTDLGDD